MKDLKNAIKEAGLKTDFGVSEIGEFDPLCNPYCASGCHSCCGTGCQPGCAMGNLKEPPE